ncbi:HAD family phosphatase [Kitasatospora sp. RB6PN24]|uniref:HAD family hydrolase n=1 Tax=Kitasatospora humi TaxID=2893891 RepID=UPI001E555E83|nr:HAD family phosphatase [Kitasatospora humi]MCC9310024.1 HAD family phosphatase [Kitasatospora humi]
MGRPAVLIDIGGVLSPDHLAAVADDWAGRLGRTPAEVMAALYGGNDDQILIGRVSEDAWWGVVAERLRLGPAQSGALRADVTRGHAWDPELVAAVRALRPAARTAIVSNAWPSMRPALQHAGLLDLVDAVVLSCEVGCAKPDPRIYELALHRLAAAPADALFIDDTPGHVTAARALGLAGHVHTDTPETLRRIAEFVRARGGDAELRR